MATTGSPAPPLAEEQVPAPAPQPHRAFRRALGEAASPATRQGKDAAVTCCAGGLWDCPPASELPTMAGVPLLQPGAGARSRPRGYSGPHGARTTRASHLTSPATVTSCQERPSRRRRGSGPQPGWPALRRAPGSTTPRQGRPHRSRWPLADGVVALLAAGGAATALIVQPFHHSQAAAGTPRTSPAARGNRCRLSHSHAVIARCHAGHQLLPRRHRHPRNRRRRASPSFSRRVSRTAVPP